MPHFSPALQSSTSCYQIIRLIGMLLCALMVQGCLSGPDNTKVVTDFELDRYLGTWYEVVRLDNRFERGLSNVQATYSLRPDGGVAVLNRGFNTEKKRWSEAEGKAFFVGEPDVGRLKVSFFGPFYGAYNVVELDKEHYSYAMVVGSDTKYLWILARDPNLDQTIVDQLVSKAKDLGFNVDEFLFVQHDEKNN